jgi:hypothetical protein
LLFPPLTDADPPGKLDNVEPAEIFTEPPMPWLVEFEDPTDKEKSPPWPPTPPTDPVFNEIPPEFPLDEEPVVIISSPEIPEEPESGVCKVMAPEVAVSLLPLEISTSPPEPVVPAPADK